MNYDFLQNYYIPTTRRESEHHYEKSKSYSTMEGAYGTYSMCPSQDTPSVNPDYYGYGGSSSYYSESYSCCMPNTTATNESYQSSDRFISPAKHGTSYTSYRTPYKRKIKYAAGGSKPKKEVPVIEEVTSDGKLVMFLGRDESYPDELNQLIHPLMCDLCNIKMNSKTIAKDHYESKVHDKHISAWLLKNYTEKGITPPAVKRFIKQGPSGPDAFHCEQCDLKLTSLTHAKQHYAGKKHQLVIAQKTKPSGAGFYNNEGKWVRTGTKLTPSHKDRRFGIGDTFKYSEFLKSSDNAGYIAPDNSTTTADTKTTTSAADTTTTTSMEAKPNKAANTNKIITPPTVEDAASFCSICQVSVTSALQMTMHLSGSKHKKKLKLAGVDPATADVTIETLSDILSPSSAIQDNVLLSAIKEEIKPDPNDLSMYRTPSGQYYCKICNTSISHLPGLEQHLKGKRHLKRLTEEKAMAALAAKKSKV